VAVRLSARLVVTNPLPTAFCHGATLLPLPSGDLLGAWFGGTAEGRPDSSIYVARLRAGAAAWDPPVEAAPHGGHPCGNPVLFLGAPGVVWLAYFRVWGEWCTGGKPCARVSLDEGRTWGPEMVLLDRPGVLTKNKPLRVGAELLLPVYDEVAWRVGIARLEIARHTDRWVFDDLAIGAASGIAMIQGTLVEAKPGRLLMLMRTKVGRIWRVESADGGRTWQGLRPTPLPNPNAGIDMARLPDGRLWLAYNATDRGRDPMDWTLRYPLCLAESADGGDTWRDLLTLEHGPGEFSYPAVVPDAAGRVHVAYTSRRTAIVHVVLDPTASEKKSAPAHEPGRRPRDEARPTKPSSTGGPGSVDSSSASPPFSVATFTGGRWQEHSTPPATWQPRAGAGSRRPPTASAPPP